MHKLLVKYLAEKTCLSQVFSEEEVAHWLTPREGIVNTFVVEQQGGTSGGGGGDGTITDFCSFYTLPSSIIGHDKYTSLKVHRVWVCGCLRCLVSV